MRWLALLSGVNVGGTGKVPMAELRAAAAAAGLRDPATLLASGNLLFDSDDEAPALERAVEAILDRRFGLKRRVLVRSALQWRAAVEANPMPQETAAAPAYLHLVTLDGAPDAAARARLAEVVVAPERMEVRGGFLYAWYPNGAGRAATDAKTVDRALAMRGTARNWNTTLKLMQLLET